MPVATPVRPSQATTPRYPTVYWALVIGYGLNRAGGVLVPFLTFYLVTHLHFSTADAGLILAAFGAGWMLGQPLAGTATDRLGRKTTVITTQLLTAASYSLLTQARTVPSLVALAALIGLTFDASRPAITAWIADLVPEATRTRAYGLQYWMLNIGGGLSGVLGGYLATSHTTGLCLVDAVTCALFAALVCTLPDTGAPSRSTATPHTGTRTWRRDRHLLVFTALSLLTLTIYQQIVYGLPLTIHSAGLSPAVYGAVNVTNAVTVLTLQPFLQPALNRLHPLRTCALGTLAITFGMGANGWVHNAAGFIVAAVLWTLGEIAFIVGASTYVTSLAPEDQRGRYLGVWGISFGASALLAPLAGAAALAHGPALLWTLATVIGTGCAICFALAPRTTPTAQNQS